MLFQCPFDILLVPLKIQILSLSFGVGMVFTNVAEDGFNRQGI
jgi:hypothetical protein